jgi:hypothetical protein
MGGRMYATLASLVDQLAGPALSRMQVIPWGAPVPAFGDPSTARVATLGLNPSNREFVDNAGRELEGRARRFHTLASLGLTRWDEADARHLELVLQSCRRYFHRNPYDRWFRKLDQLLVGTGASYYAGTRASTGDRSSVACHLDLIPYATRRRWMELTARQRACLLERPGDALGALLRDSPIRILVLNGQSVVDYFEALTDVRLDRHERVEWTLPRRAGALVQGVSYWGIVQTVGGVDLGRDLLVLGYNHNIQSSFGVTSGAVSSIAAWVGGAAADWLA